MPDPLHVLVAGGGVVGLETLLALRDLAGERVRCTLLTPEPDFVYRPMAVAEPFARGRAQRHALDAIAADLGAELVRGRLTGVDAPAQEAVADTGRLSFDALVIGVGAGVEPALPRVLTWTPESDDEVYGGLLRDLDEGYTKRVAFIVPVGAAWPLPAYELALMTAWQTQAMGHDDVQITIYTGGGAAGDLRRRRERRPARRPRRGGHRGGHRRGRDRDRRAPRGRTGGAGTRRRARRDLAARGRLRATRPPERRPRVRALRRAPPSGGHRHGVGGGRRDRVPDQARRARRPAGRRGRRGDRRPRWRRQPRPFRPVLRGV